MEAVTAILGRKPTVKEKRKVEAIQVTLPCLCGKFIKAGYMHKCLYCEQWLCAECAEEHFGETRDEYHARERLSG